MSEGSREALEYLAIIVFSAVLTLAVCALFDVRRLDPVAKPSIERKCNDQINS